MPAPVLALLQARVSSNRLPRKVLLPIEGSPMILRQIERVRQSEKITDLLLVTSTDESDNELTQVCGDRGVRVFRGSLNDVLDRFYQAVKSKGAKAPQTLVRLTGDCPLLDPTVMDETIAYFEKGEYDFVSNALEPHYPDGLDTEVFTPAALERAWREAKPGSEREHVTYSIYRNPEKFRVGSYCGGGNLPPGLEKLRWTVDQQSDYEFVKAVYAALYDKNPAFSMGDILKLLEKKPELGRINGAIGRNEGLEKSLLQDQRRKP